MLNEIILPEVECIFGSIAHIIYQDSHSGFFVCILDTQKNDQATVTGSGIAHTLEIGDEIECFGHWLNDKKHGLQFQATIIQKHSKHLLETSLQEIENLISYLKSVGISAKKSQIIFNALGQNALALIHSDPYALLNFGVSFKAVELLSEQLQFPKDSIARLSAIIGYLLNQWCEKGHCAILKEELISLARKKYQLSLDMIEVALEQLIKDNKIVSEIIEREDYYYPKILYDAELAICNQLTRLSTHQLPWKPIDFHLLKSDVECKIGMSFSHSQVNAIETVLSSKITIITGGPGVGKTTLMKALLLVLRSEFLNIALCAPTGRAAKRLTEATQLEAKTIHRLLQFDPKTESFKYDSDHPLPIDLLIIDESSMVDLVLLNHLLCAIPTHAALIFVGDIDQLASIKSGAILSDLIASKTIPTVFLTEIFRQAEMSRIIVNANRINQGEMILPNTNPSDFYTIYAETVEETHHLLLEVVCKRLPAYHSCDPIKDIQVLTPMNRTGLGTQALNITLQQRLNGDCAQKITRFGMTFSPGDKVIQMINNYEKDVYNGDIGIVERIDISKGRVVVYFDGVMKHYEVNELDELSLAYAISIHKSQGSEFPIVVIPLVMQHYLLLARNVLYTAITRGKQMVVLIGQKKAIQRAIDNHAQAHRITNLAYRLRSHHE